MSTLKLALVSALALGLAVPAFAQTAAMSNSTSAPAATAKVETKATPAKIETKSNVSIPKSGMKSGRTVATKTSRTSSLHKVSHKKHQHKTSAEHSTSKM